MQSTKRVMRRLLYERLESRCVLSAMVGTADDLHAVIVAGDPAGVPGDSPDIRIDANSNTRFAGVGSLQISANRGTFICTGTAIDATHVLTAGHCVDLNDDGRSDKRDGIRSVTFNINSDTDTPTDQIDAAIKAVSWTTHPDFTGFNRPSVNDDLAVITLGAALPAGVPTYALASADMVAGGTHLYMVGYGRSGDGVNGYSTGPSWTIKRVGENMVDAFYGQDDGSRTAANEVFRFDFDGPGGNGPLGGPTLGNNKETTLGGGDSGGPSFAFLGNPNDPASVAAASNYVLLGVNTFTQGTNAPLFGSMGGGINVFPYESWIQGVQASSGGGGSSGHSSGGAQFASILNVMESSSLLESDLDGQALGGPAFVTSSLRSSSNGDSVFVAQGARLVFETQFAATPAEIRGQTLIANTDLKALRENASDEATVPDAGSDEFAATIDAVFRQGPI